MNVIILIENREAIPVRALPFVTGWSVSPDVLASSLAMTDLIGQLKGFAVFHWHGGNAAQMLPKEWDNIEADLESLLKKLKAEEKVTGGNYRKWQSKSISLLPESCFVWRNEFEAAFQKAYSPAKRIIIGERSGDREVNFQPRIPPKLAPIVMEGFEHADRFEGGQWPWGGYETPLLRILAGAVARWCSVDGKYPNKKSNQVQEWIESEMTKVGLPVSKSLIDHIETIISPRAYSHTRQRVRIQK